MSESPIIVMAEFRALPGKENFFIEQTANLMKKMRTHKGVMIHSFQQCESKPELFVFYEQYESESALADHGSKPEVAEWRKKLPEMAERISWRRFRMIDYFRTAEPLK